MLVALNSLLTAAVVNIFTTNLLVFMILKCKMILFAVPTGFPRNVKGNSPSPTSIVLKWTPPALEEQSGDILQYIVNVTHAGTLETTQHFTNTTNITITSLQPYTTYVCFIAARTAIGIGPFSLIFIIQTEEGG